MKIAVYMGSFRPMHIGHIAIVRYLLEKGGYDKVYLIVSPQNPFKDKDLEQSARERLKAAEDAVKRAGLQGRAVVDPIEFTMERPSYSIRTMDALAKREPDNRFTLVIGGDNLREILSWKEGGRLLTDYGIAVYPRTGFNIVRDCAIMKRQHKMDEELFGEKKDGAILHRPYHIKLLRDAPVIDVSSTQIRQMSAEGKDVSELLA